MDHQQENISSAVAIPLAQAITSGAVVGVSTWILAKYAQWNNPGELGALIGAITATAVWFYSLGHWRSVLASVLDIVPDPIEVLPAEHVSVVLTDEDTAYPQGWYARLPATKEQLVQMACMIMAGASFSESTLCGSGRPFSRQQLTQLRDALVDRGYLAWRSEYPQQGVRLTGQGRALVRTFALEGTSPPTLLELEPRAHTKNDEYVRGTQVR